MAGFWGKHPNYDGFVSAGLDDNAHDAVIPWLNPCLATMRDIWADEWEQVFDAMPALGFWIGPGISGTRPVAGVMSPSRDRAGARYPLLVLGRGEVVPPMLVQGGFHQAAADALLALGNAPEINLADWPLELGEAEPAPPLPEDPSLVWASDPALSGPELLAEIAQYDHAASCNDRVHFWSLSGDRQGVVLSCAQMPDADAFAWLIKAGGLPAEPAPEITDHLPPPRLEAGTKPSPSPSVDPNTKERLILMPEWQARKDAFWQVRTRNNE